MESTHVIPGLRPGMDSDLASFCARLGVRSLRVFGSATRAELHAESDIDVLLEFFPGVDPDLFELGGMQQDLSELFDHEVDLRTPEMFTPTNLQRVLGSSVLGYAA